jgi:capsular exopolysaccharide synthesis family protein
VFLSERLNNRIRSGKELENLTGAPVLGILPSVGRRMERAEIIRYIREKPRSSLVEAIRSLRTSILYASIDRPPKVVMFSSSLPQEGKSTTSMLMAMSSQQMGKSAIIVDCDLRLPQLAGLVGAEDHAHGLLSVLDGTVALVDAVFKDPDTGLHILTTVGSEQSSTLNAADILSSNKFSGLLKALSEDYDLVILDTPPTLVVADARIVARHADAVVYVVRWNATPREAIEEGLKSLRSVGTPITGLVLTQVNQRQAAGYSYGGYSAYGEKVRGYYTN